MGHLKYSRDCTLPRRWIVYTRKYTMVWLHVTTDLVPCHPIVTGHMELRQ